MFVRVSTFQGSPEGLDRSTKISVERAVPALKETDGAAGVLVLGDRETGRTLALTFWASEEAMRASEAMADRVREETSAEAEEEIIGVERFELLHEERWG